MSERSQLRSNQLITTFGPGAMVDFPAKSVIVAGLHEWRYARDKPCRVDEPRLAAKVGRLLGKKTVELRSPPPAEETIFQNGTVPAGVGGYVFPHWFIVQKNESTDSGHRRRRLVHKGDLTTSKRFHDPDTQKKFPVVPVRFVRACRKGHVGDIPWRRFVHRGDDLCQSSLWIEERGTTGDLSEIWIICDCGAVRSMREAAQHELKPLGMCNGSRPWLDDRDDQCGEPSRLLLRTASNAHFPQMMSVISIPDSVADIDVVVLDLWEEAFSEVGNVADLERERRRPSQRSRLEPFTNDELLNAIDRTRRGVTSDAVTRSVKDIEFDALSRAKAEAIADVPDGDYYGRELERSRWDAPWLAGIEKVVLVHRLREVTALLGFTRFDPAGPDVSGELDIKVERAPLVDNPTWMPAVENRGEGVFIQLKASAVQEWLGRPEVEERTKQLRAGFDAWVKERPGFAVTFPGPSYIMLHSLAHLLITAISLECGYPASSLRERIYAPIPDKAEMTDCYGILIFTGSSDAQGTLGGLVYAARDIRRHLSRACQLGKLCSNDPVCASHQPSHSSTEQLSGCACHGCLYISETSCEQFNRFLDRSLVVPTIDQLGCEFFPIP